MPIDEKRKKRLRRQIFDTPEMDEMMAPFREPVEPPPETPVDTVGPTREAFGTDPLEAPEGPRYTISQLKEDYGDIPSLLSDVYGETLEKTKEQAEYHKRSARYDALGRAIGSLGGFVSAHMGGPVAPQTPGRSREHMDRYEQLLLDYEEKERAQDLLVTQGMLKQKGMFADIMREQDMQAYQEKRRDFEYKRDRAAKEGDVKKERKWRGELMELQTDERKKVIDYQDEVRQRQETRAEQAATRAEIDKQKRAGEAVGEPEKTWYTLRHKGKNMPVSGAVARDMAASLPGMEKGDLFADASGKMEYTDRKLERMLAKYGKDYLVERDVVDERGNVIGQEMDLRTQAEELPKPDELGSFLVNAFDRVLKGEITEEQLTGIMQAYMNEEGAPGIAVTDASYYGQRVAEALTIRPEYDRDGNKVHPLQNIPLPKGMKMPKGWPRGLEKNFWNYLNYYDAKLNRESKEIEGEPTTREGRGSEEFDRRIRDIGSQLKHLQK